MAITRVKSSNTFSSVMSSRDTKKNNVTRLSKTTPTVKTYTSQKKGATVQTTVKEYSDGRTVIVAQSVINPKTGKPYTDVSAIVDGKKVTPTPEPEPTAGQIILSQRKKITGTTNIKKIQEKGTTAGQDAAFLSGIRNVAMVNVSGSTAAATKGINDEITRRKQIDRINTSVTSEQERQGLAYTPLGGTSRELTSDMKVKYVPNSFLSIPAQSPNRKESSLPAGAGLNFNPSQKELYTPVTVETISPSKKPAGAGLNFNPSSDDILTPVSVGSPNFLMINPEYQVTDDIKTVTYTPVAFDSLSQSFNPNIRTTEQVYTMEEALNKRSKEASSKSKSFLYGGASFFANPVNDALLLANIFLPGGGLVVGGFFTYGAVSIAATKEKRTSFIQGVKENPYGFAGQMTAGAFAFGGSSYLKNKFIFPKGSFFGSKLTYSSIKLQNAKGGTQRLWGGVSLERGNFKSNVLLGYRYKTSSVVSVQNPLTGTFDAVSSYKNLPFSVPKNTRAVTWGTPKLDLRVVNPEYSMPFTKITQATIIRDNLPYSSNFKVPYETTEGTVYFPAAQGEYLNNIMRVTSETRGVKSVSVTKNVITDTRSLSDLNVNKVLKFGIDEKGYNYGSFSAQQSVRESIFLKRGGAAGDIDQMFKWASSEVLEPKVTKLTTSFENVKARQKGLLVEVKQGNKYVHAVDIHAYDTPEIAPTKFLSYPIEKPKIKISSSSGKAKFSSLEQESVSKASSISTLRGTNEGVIFAPEGHRLKDIVDYKLWEKELYLSKGSTANELAYFDTYYSNNVLTKSASSKAPKSMIPSSAASSFNLQALSLSLAASSVSSSKSSISGSASKSFNPISSLSSSLGSNQVQSLSSKSSKSSSSFSPSSVSIPSYSSILSKSSKSSSSFSPSSVSILSYSSSLSKSSKSSSSTSPYSSPPFGFLTAGFFLPGGGGGGYKRGSKAKKRKYTPTPSVFQLLTGVSGKTKQSITGFEAVRFDFGRGL